MKIKDASMNKLRFNYTLTLKSTKSSKSTKSKQEHKESLESISLCNTRRFSLSPKKSRTQNISSEISKLEEELDSQEISLKIYEARKHVDENRDIAEAEIYEKYIEKLLNLLNTIDTSLGKSFSRGWRGYKNSIVRIKNHKETPRIEIEKIDTQENYTQFPEENTMALGNSVDIDKYIFSLHNVMKGINKMQLGSIIEKLDELSHNLKTVEVPSASSSPEVDEIDFTDTVKSIHTKLKAHVLNKKPKKTKIKIEKIDKTMQTVMKFEDFKVVENMKLLILERDKTISEINRKLRKKEDVEEMYLMKTKECEDLKKSIFEMKTTMCKHCKQKKEKLDESQLEIKNLQITANKTIVVEKELQTTKSKLEESLVVISSKNVKITKLTENLEELNKKVAEAKAQRAELEEKLAEEQKIREAMQKQLRKTNEQSFEIKQYSGSSALSTTLASKSGIIRNEIISENIGRGAIKAMKKYEQVGEDKIKQNNRSVSPFIKADLHMSKIGSLTPSEIAYEVLNNYSSPEGKKAGFIRERLLHKGSGIPVQDIKKSSKHQNIIMQALNLTKEEYLALSKKARLEIYEALYEHREKCGSDCEHLRRAMLIKQKDRGPLYPTKKYNIS
ncbi:hypothetical protein SteCoe_32907 [Stentor coeruleus]|uniref:Uncharacterized protein n=1 Tax=Stentor coeruleus TaxID=5963 RepID=A0A1R2AXX6_9CILI|nr:hypothetical protein SteCoe_32907 [Stentor coeruleus]